MIGSDVVAHAASLRLRGRWMQAVRLLSRQGDEVLPALSAAHLDLFHWTRGWWSRAADVSIRAMAKADDAPTHARAASDAAFLTYLQAYQRDELLRTGVGGRLQAAAGTFPPDPARAPVPDPAAEVSDLRGLLLYRVGLYREHVEQDMSGARESFLAAHRIAERSGDRLLLGYTHRHLATTAVANGDEQAALRDFVLSLRNREAAGWLPGQVPALLSLAALRAVDVGRRRELLHRAHRIGAELRWPPLIRSMIKSTRHVSAPDDFALR
jgi:hypothetical protein